MKKSSILAHRGLWSKDFPPNSKAAIKNAIARGYGLETDLRDYNGRIVVSHDPTLPNIEHLNLTDMLTILIDSNSMSRVALNIKSDGLARTIAAQISEYPKDLLDSLFCFDMSIPDTMAYLDMDFMSVYMRLSEYEPSLSLLEASSGVWVDNFSGSYPQVKTCKDILSRGKRCTIVSSELHGRNHETLWNEIKFERLHQNDSLELCTDFPDDAYQFFS